MPFSLLTVWKICGHWKVIFMLIKINVAFNFVSIPFNVSGNILFVLIKMASAVVHSVDFCITFVKKQILDY